MTYDELPDVVFETTAEPQDAMQINRELNLARRIIEETGSNLFLTGKAGTGKTTFLRHLRYSARKRMIVLAPTGVAAINAGGMTIHSFFQLPFSPYIPGFGFPQETDRKKYQFSKEKRHVLNTLDLLVIDEVSMVRPDTLDAIDEIMRRYRDSSQPFGGVQLLLIGDMRQLAPIIPDAYRDMLQPHYRSPYFFESRALADAGYMTVELQTVYRQNDTEFVGMLNSIRDGRATHSVLEALNSRVASAKAAAAADTTIRLTTHNRQADSINASRMAALAGNIYSYTAKIEGKFPENSYPADLHLELKPKARVMFVKNDTGRDRRYYNGLTGTVVRLGNSAVSVQPDT
ncbi:MAG: AAA family ATPase, partial [Muribaculaceae bacterium]|nr:AAA family ATPase [Muribaculaceae bacterium]